MITNQNNLASMIAQYRAQQPAQQAPQPVAQPQPPMQRPMPVAPERAAPPISLASLYQMAPGVGYRTNWF